MSIQETEVRLGQQATAFQESDLGRYIIGCSKQDHDDAKDELFNLDPYAFTDLISLQNKLQAIKNKALIALSLQTYLDETKVIGEQAKSLLASEDET